MSPAIIASMHQEAVQLQVKLGTRTCLYYPDLRMHCSHLFGIFMPNTKHMEQRWAERWNSQKTFPRIPPESPVHGIIAWNSLCMQSCKQLTWSYKLSNQNTIPFQHCVPHILENITVFLCEHFTHCSQNRDLFKSLGIQVVHMAHGSLFSLSSLVSYIFLCP